MQKYESGFSMKNVDIKFSVIIPHKNNPLLLQRCLNSIPKREDVQVIVIDDNSDPQKVDFNHFPGNAESGIEVYFTKSGKGAGYARNEGLKHARGKWLIFADADDYFTVDAFKIFDSQYYNEAEIIYFCSQSVYSDTKKNAERADFYNTLVSNYLTGCYSEDYIRIAFEVPWAKMVSHSLVKRNNISFEEVLAGNDVMFSTLSGYYANAISAELSCVYVVTVSQGSITKRKNYNVFLSRLKVILRKNKFLKAHGLGKYQKSIMYNFVETLKCRPYQFFNLCIILLKYRQSPFVGITNWFITLNKVRKREKRDSGYYTK